MFTIPKLGYLANYIQHPPGTYVAISAGAILLLLVFIPDLFSDDKKEQPAVPAGDAPEESEKPEKRKKPKKSTKYQGKYSR